MSNFYDIEEEKDFEKFMQKQYEDDENLKNKFNDYSHKQFQYCLINMGIMLDIVRGYFYFESKKIDETIVKIEKDKVRTRRVNKMLRELNQKINLRYELDEDTEIISALVIYNEEGFLMIEKSLFADLLMEKGIE